MRFEEANIYTTSLPRRYKRNFEVSKENLSLAEGVTVYKLTEEDFPRKDNNETMKVKK